MSKGLNFKAGLKDGIPIGLGYLSVSFGFGISAVSQGVPLIAALLISMTNLTSAGQVAGLAIIAEGGSYIELAITQFVINIRYSLMGLSLAQKTDDSFSFVRRLFSSFFLTDEIFAVSSSRIKKLTFSYMNGLSVFPYFGWALGTFLGAFAGNILPDIISDALGLAIYGMFVAIVVPPAKKKRGILFAVVVAVIMSCILKFVPLFSFVTSGFSFIICSVISAVLASLVFPVEEADDNDS